MQTIYKYPFKIASEVIIEMPKGAQILSIQIQNDIPTMWALIDTEKEMENVLFHIFGTGHTIPRLFNYGPLDHLATFQQGIYVWHMFLRYYERFQIRRDSPSNP